MNLPSVVAALERSLRHGASQDSWGGEFLHCSDLGQATAGGCLRQVWLRINGHEENPPELGKLWRFARSNHIHEALTPLLAEGLGEGWRVACRELPLGEELSASFGIDKGAMDVGLLNDKERIAIVVDYKTIKTGGLLRLLGPKEEHMLQVQGYAEAWQRRLDLESRLGWPQYTVLGSLVVYVDREGQGGFREFFVARDRPAVERAAETLRGLRSMTEPPPGPPPQGKKEHWRCEYRTRDGEVSQCQFLGASCPGSMALASEAPPAEPPKAKIIDLMAALKASLAVEPTTSPKPIHEPQPGEDD